MVEVTNPAGRLILFSVRSPVDDGNAEAAALELRSVVQAISGKVVVVTDLTDARTLAPTTAERFVRVMKADNPRLERSAVMLGTSSATLALQIERMVREAANPARQTFREADELVRWLQAVLTPDETLALSAYLAPRAHTSVPAPEPRLA